MSNELPSIEEVAEVARRASESAAEEKAKTQAWGITVDALVEITELGYPPATEIAVKALKASIAAAKGNANASP